jgi:cytochrome P450
MLDMRARYGDLVRYQNLLGNLIFAYGPENNRQLHTETDVFLSRPFVLPAKRNSSQHRLRQSIFALNGHSHHRMRHQLLPSFQRSTLPNYHESIIELVGNATQDWKVGEHRNLHRDMHLLVWGVVRKLLYGLEETDASEALHAAMEHWMFQTFSPSVRSFPFNLPFTPYRRMLKEASRLEQKFLGIMQARRAEGAAGHDALSALLRFQHADGRPATDQELVGHAMTLFLVAYETTGNTLTWTLFLLAQHPEIQHAVLDELAEWRGEVPPADALEQLPVMNRVLKESTRILPAVPYNRRITACDVEMGGYLVPKKTRILFSHYVTHHMPEIYQEPERFWPDRWETIKPSPAEYLPFGAGVRTCLGAALSQFVIKIALSQILPKWKIAVVPHSRIDRQLGISLGPRGGIPVILNRQDRLIKASPIDGDIHEMVDLRHIDAAPSRLRVAA